MTNSVFSCSKGRGGGEGEKAILECLPPISIRPVSMSIALVHALPLSNSLLVLSMAGEALLSATPVIHAHCCFETPVQNWSDTRLLCCQTIPVHSTASLASTALFSPLSFILVLPQTLADHNTEVLGHVRISLLCTIHSKEAEILLFVISQQMIGRANVESFSGSWVN